MSQAPFSVLPRPVVLLFFWIGLFAAVCIRSLTLVAEVSPVASTWIWRLAMVCYTFFFGYRYLIGIRRRRVIQEQNLVAEIQNATDLDETTRQATLYILNSIIRSKELFNYIFICVLSVLALLLDLLIS